MIYGKHMTKTTCLSCPSARHDDFEGPMRQKPQIGETTATNDSGSNLSAPVSSTPAGRQGLVQKEKEQPQENCVLMGFYGYNCITMS